MSRPYVSLTLRSTTPALTPAFSKAKEMDAKVFKNPQDHTVLCDPEISAGSGFLTHDEAAILHACAKASPGEWVEAYSGTGWATAHIAAAPGVAEVAALDPAFGKVEYKATPTKTLARFQANIDAALKDRAKVVVPLGMSIAQLVESLKSNKQAGDFEGIFVSEVHEKLDELLKYLNPNGCVLLHNALSKPTQDLAKSLIASGFKAKVYRTPQVMVVLWRGTSFVPPNHTPDPAFNWDLWLKGHKFAL